MPSLVYFTATSEGATARILFDTRGRSAEIRNRLMTAGVKCGQIFPAPPDFSREKEEIDLALQILQLAF